MKNECIAMFPTLASIETCWKRLDSIKNRFPLAFKEISLFNFSTHRMMQVTGIEITPLSSSSVPSLGMENRAGNHAPPRYPVCCCQSCLSPRVEIHCHSLLLHRRSPCFFRSSPRTFPFWCPHQGNSWEAAVVHAQHVLYPFPPPFPN